MNKTVEIFDGYEVTYGRKRYRFSDATHFDVDESGILRIYKNGSVLQIFRIWSNFRVIYIKATV